MHVHDILYNVFTSSFGKKSAELLYDFMKRTMLYCTKQEEGAVLSLTKISKKSPPTCCLMKPKGSYLFEEPLSTYPWARKKELWCEGMTEKYPVPVIDRVVKSIYFGDKKKVY